MDGKANLPIKPDSSSPDFLRNVQAAVKRHRPRGTMQSNCIRPRRTLLRQPHDSLSLGNNSDASITPPSISSESSTGNPSQIQDAHKKVHFSVQTNTSSQGASDGKATELENLSSHMSSLGFTEMEWVEGNQPEASIGFSQDSKDPKIQQAEPDLSMRSDGGVSCSMLPKRTKVTGEHMQQFRNFLSQPATQSSVAGPSFATTTSVHSTSAPMLNSTTRVSHSQHLGSGSCAAAEPLGEFGVYPNPATERVTEPPNSNTTGGETNRISVDQAAIAVRAPDSHVNAEMEFKESDKSKGQQETGNSKYTYCDDVKLNEGKEPVDVAIKQTQAPMPTTSSLDVKYESSKLEKREKATSGKGSSAARKRTYDPDLFFKVNGKLYQRLGKIGSGGSSEVHKVISSDCKIYALKKIKLKGRDYATAYGFCQEIEYLNRLKGKDNIIQLIDYEVTDKALLQEVMKGSFSIKDGRVKDDGYIYMVLEYGEIDLAHMLSQKWKELDGSNQIIDENWLRFYWQQILQAVNTIHEERIVHSDLKPANFLLVKGSLKLIDFGIAKAIMSDTTNIQRDSQVGTLSYMSPEAFMCNETDANGNLIKCGRPSDIWSLGCILYQMVYGRTPFSEYKTFWAKFKVITDPSHEITYEPVSNPWLVDLMKRCLAWDRNQRWRIPQLLQHPFLAPHVLHHSSLSQDHSCKFLHLIAETCTYDPEASQLCQQLQRVLGDPLELTTHSLNSRDQQRKLLSHVSELCIQLQERLVDADIE